MELYVDVMNACDLACIFCMRKSDPRDFSFLEKMIRFIDANMTNAVQTVRVGGMEPLAFAGIFELVRHIKTKNSSARIVVCTAGVRLKDNSFVKKLVHAGVGGFEIPLYGSTSSTHDAVTKKRGSFNDVKKALNNLKKYKGLEVKIHTVLFKNNAKNAKEVSVCAHKLGYALNKVIIYRPKKNDSVKHDMFMPSLDDVKHISDIGSDNLTVEGLPYCLEKNILGKIRPIEKVLRDNVAASKDIRKFAKNINMIKPKQCKPCIFFSHCDGFAKEYEHLWIITPVR